MIQPVPKHDVCESKLFRNNRSQAVRIRAEFEFSGRPVLIREEGDRLIIEPEPRPTLLDTLRGLAPLHRDDAFPDDLDMPLKPVEL